MACCFEIVGNETLREESGFDRASEFFLVWDQRRSGRWELTPLATVPAALVPAGPAFAVIYDFCPKRRGQNRGFAKSEHMTPSSVSSA
jgi:hypothetical protein